MYVQLTQERREDAAQLDEVVVAIGAPDGTPLLTLSVTKDGVPFVEYDSPEDLADGIRAIQQLVSRTLVAGGSHNMR